MVLDGFQMPYNLAYNLVIITWSLKYDVTKTMLFSGQIERLEGIGYYFRRTLSLLDVNFDEIDLSDVYICLVKLEMNDELPLVLTKDKKSVSFHGLDSSGTIESELYVSFVNYILHL